MRFLLLILLSCAGGVTLQAQQTPQRFIDEGVDLHDRGYLDEAIAKYDSALSLVHDHYLASYEKALTLSELKRYDDAAALCRHILDVHKDSSSEHVYVLYGSMLDYAGKGEAAVKAYSEGIRRNPEGGALYFNRAVTYYGLDEKDKAASDLTRSISLNPVHAGSHALMARVKASSNRIYALMANLVFLVIEPTGDRAREGLKRLETLVNSGVERKDDKTINITLLMDPDEGKKARVDNFHSVELFLSLSAAAAHTEKYEKESAPDRLKREIEGLAAVLSGHLKDEKGFGWRYYAPFFVAAADAKQLDVMAHLAYASGGDDDNAAWLNTHKEAIGDFYKWFKAYPWPKNEAR